jgi:hypothetical protein
LVCLFVSFLPSFSLISISFYHFLQIQTSHNPSFHLYLFFIFLIFSFLSLSLKTLSNLQSKKKNLISMNIRSTFPVYFIFIFARAEEGGRRREKNSCFAGLLWLIEMNTWFECNNKSALTHFISKC